MWPRILSGSRAGCVNNFHPADLPQQNKNSQHSIQKRQVGTKLKCQEMGGKVDTKWEWQRAIGILKEHGG